MKVTSNKQPKVGDRYIVTISEVIPTLTESGDEYNLYKMSGFSALVFDDRGLAKLSKMTDSYIELNENSRLELVNNEWYYITGQKINTASLEDIIEEAVSRGREAGYAQGLRAAEVAQEPK